MLSDFCRVAAAGVNALRTYTAPPRWLIDTAHRYGLFVMVGFPWEQHIAFLDDRHRAGHLPPCRCDRPSGRLASCHFVLDDRQ